MGEVGVLPVPAPAAGRPPAAYRAARSRTMAALRELAVAQDAAREAGGEKPVTRHHAQGKLLARERLELLVDRDSPLLELSATAGWATGGPAGAGVVSGLGVVEDRICCLIATEPTVRGGVIGAAAVRKLDRAAQIAGENRLPLLLLLELTGVGGGEQAEVSGQINRLAGRLAELAAAGIPIGGICFGDHRRLTGADLTAWFDHAVTLQRGPASEPPTGSATAPVTRLASDERNALLLTRQWLRRTVSPGGVAAAGGGTTARPAPVVAPRALPPRRDPDDLLALPGHEPRQILDRVLDGSEFGELHPGDTGTAGGSTTCTRGSGWYAGWGTLYGHPVAVLATGSGHLGDQAATTGVRLVEQAALAGAPVLLLRQGHTPERVESALSTAVARTGVPVVAIRVAGSRGVSALTALARFRFSWPTAGAATTLAEPVALPLPLSAQLDDDGVIDPRDTRPVLGVCFGAIRAGRP